MLPSTAERSRVLNGRLGPLCSAPCWLRLKHGRREELLERYFGPILNDKLAQYHPQIAGAQGVSPSTSALGLRPSTSGWNAMPSPNRFTMSPE